MLVSGAFIDRTCTHTRLITEKMEVCPVGNTFAYLFHVQSFTRLAENVALLLPPNGPITQTKKFIAEHIWPGPRIVQPNPLFPKSQRVFEIDRLIRLELYRALRPREESQAYFRRSGAGCPREKQYIALYVEKTGVLEDLQDNFPSSVGKRLHSFYKLVQIVRRCTCGSDAARS